MTPHCKNCSDPVPDTSHSREFCTHACEDFYNWLKHYRTLDKYISPKQRAEEDAWINREHPTDLDIWKRCLWRDLFNADPD